MQFIPVIPAASTGRWQCSGADKIGNEVISAVCAGTPPY